MTFHTRSLALLPLLAVAFSSAAFACSLPVAAVAEPHHTVVHADDIAWGAAPPSLPAGARAAVLLGSPAKPGPFVLRLKLPDGFVIPPHRHTKDEFVTVISGGFGITSGEKFDKDAARLLPASSFVHLPAGMPHFAVAHGETIVQINGVGPFDVVYVDPSDDPRKKTN